MAGQKGRSGSNPNSWNNKKEKKTPWSEAINRCMETHKPADRRRKLDLLAQRVYEMAMEGNVEAVKEIGNRLDGKARQSIEITDDGDSLLLKTVIGVAMDKNEAAQIYRNMMKTIPSNPEPVVIEHQSDSV